MTQPFDIYIEEVAQFRLRVLAPNRDEAEVMVTDRLIKIGLSGTERLDRIRYVYEVEPVSVDGGAS